MPAAAPLADYRFDTLAAFVGRELGVTGWLTLEQSRIDAFAACTGDHQWLHTDPERARRESPFGGTVAHGYLLVALLARFQTEVGAIPPDAGAVVNGRLERVRFSVAVPAGARVRGRVHMERVSARGTTCRRVSLLNTIELEGHDRPALTARTVSLVLAPGARLPAPDQHEEIPVP